MRKAEQMRLFNIFTRQEYVISFKRIYEEVEFLGVDELVIVPQDVVENTMCSPFLLLFQIHSPTHMLFMVWDVERNRSKWKVLATEAIRDDAYKVTRLTFGNALMGYLAGSIDSEYMYILRDLATGIVVQTFNLDEYSDPLSESEFDCSFTSFVFIACQPRSFLDNYLQSDRNTCTTAHFDVYSISSGHKLYVLQCPMQHPDAFDDPVLPWFHRTDESERYWIFLCPRLFSQENDPVNRVCVWDVVLQQWTLLASHCVESQDCIFVYKTAEGRMRMVQVNQHAVDEFEEEEKALARYRWKRVPTVKEAMKLDIPRLDSVFRSN